MTANAKAAPGVAAPKAAEGLKRVMLPFIPHFITRQEKVNR